MLRIRLQRTGAKNKTSYRLVVTPKSNAAKGKFLEVLGFYMPTRTPVTLELNTERISHWVSKGAIPSDTTARLLKKNGMKGMEKYIQRYTKRTTKNPSEEAPAPAPAAPAAEAAPVADAPAKEGDTAEKQS